MVEKVEKKKLNYLNHPKPSQLKKTAGYKHEHLHRTFTIYLSMKVQNLLENTKQQMRKGILELCIMSIISDEGEAYPSDIITRLEESQLIVVQGTMYPLLARLKGAGLLDYTWKESDAGPPRKYYALTNEGHEFLGGLIGTWGQLVEAVKHSTKNLKANK